MYGFTTTLTDEGFGVLSGIDSQRAMKNELVYQALQAVHAVADHGEPVRAA
ncbi:MAG: hypothetical protein Q7U28_10085 [Aquabacterium sp.]|nr:hypothetical protein [Aquabacterium sp.]